MITEDYVSFETAKLLKEKRFEGFTMFSYSTKGTTMCGHWENETDWLPKCTHQMAMKWLREKHKIMITIIPQEVSVGVDRMCYAIYRITEDLYQPLCNGKVDSFDNSYEEAIEAAIKYSLENLI